MEETPQRLLPPDLRLNHVLMILSGILFVLVVFVLLGVAVFVRPQGVLFWPNASLAFVCLPVVIVLCCFRWSGLRSSAERSRVEQNATGVACFAHIAVKDEDGVRPSGAMFALGGSPGWILVFEERIEFYRAHFPFGIRSTGRRLRSIRRDELTRSQRIMAARGHAFSRLYLETRDGLIADVQLVPAHGTSLRGVSDAYIDEIAQSLPPSGTPVADST